MKFGVKIKMRPVILDTQGRAVEETLKRQGFSLEQCRVGRYVEIEVPSSDEEEALKQVRQMTEYVLFNPLLETYEIERLKST
jgi:phosphoribosylformylglycinamidine synthase subunit PurS